MTQQEMTKQKMAKQEMQNNLELTLLEKIQFYLLYGFAKIVDFLGFSFCKHLGNGIGSLMWFFLAERRLLATKNMQERLNITPEKAKELAYKAFRHNARSFIEITMVRSFSFAPTRTKLRIAEPELLHELRSTQKPVVAATAHLGAWELLAALTGSLYDDDRQRMIVVKQYPNKGVQAFISSCRESHGAQMVGNKMVAVHVLRALKKKATIAFLVDHSALRHEALSIDFLGAPAAVNMGPALLAIRGDAVVQPIFLLREEDGYVLHLQKALDTTTLTGTREEKVEQVAEFYTKAVEKIVMQYPEQWFWMHNRWKSYRIKK